MKMRKMFWAVLAIIPLGIFAQEVKYVTVPVSQDYAPAATYQYQSQRQVVSQPLTLTNELFRDTLKNSERKAIHTTFMKNNFRDNWYVNLGVGAGMLMSEESRYAGIFKLAQPAFSFSLGTWVTPIVGARINATGGKLQGFSVWYDQSMGNFDGPHWGHGDYYIGMSNVDPLDGNRLRTNTYLNAESPKYLTPDLGYAVGQYIEETFLEGRKYPRFGNASSTGIQHHSRGAGYDYFMKYAGVSFDLMLDVTTLFDRYRPNRFWHLNLFLGPGYTHTFREEKWIDDLPISTYTDINGQLVIEDRIQGVGKTRIGPNGQQQVDRSRSAVNCVMAKTGMEMTFRLSKQMSLNLESQLMFVPEIFDRKAGDGNTQDLVWNIFGSLSYKFKERHFYEPLTCCTAPPAYIAPVVNEARYNCCEDIAAGLNRLADVLDRRLAAPPTPGPAPEAYQREIEQITEHLRVVIHFVIDRWEVRQSEMYKLDEIARFMNRFPQVRVSIAGYADVQTAYPAYNKRLSERRANEVARILTTKYGIDRSRLRVSFYGDTVQPFEINELNRAVIAFDIP